MAHRGNRAAAPENTLASFRQAFEVGAEILETDVHVARDGEFVLIHDSTLDRTTEATGAVEERDSLELASIRASRGWPGFENERIPLLRDLLSLVPQDRALVLELKSKRFLERSVCERLALRLESQNLLNRVAVISFDRPILDAFRAAVPEIPIGLVTLKHLRPPAGLDLVGPAWPALFLNPLFVFEAHRMGMLLAALDPASNARLLLYCLLGCDAVLTDDPGATKKRRDQIRSWICPGERQLRSRADVKETRGRSKGAPHNREEE